MYAPVLHCLAPIRSKLYNVFFFNYTKYILSLLDNVTHYNLDYSDSTILQLQCMEVQLHKDGNFSKFSKYTDDLTSRIVPKLVCCLPIVSPVRTIL